jgi:hypothetical protein
MAKRARSRTRPGQRAPLQRSGTSRSSLGVPPLANPVTPRPATLTPEEEARAAEIEARLVAAERSAEEAARRQVGRRRPVEHARETPVRTGSIAVRAQQEYAYVARDVKRIALIGGSLLAILIGLWLVSHFAGIGVVPR